MKNFSPSSLILDEKFTGNRMFKLKKRVFDFSRDQSTGFTLIELLVVISIIAILIGFVAAGDAIGP